MNEIETTNTEVILKIYVKSQILLLHKFIYVKLNNLMDIIATKIITGKNIIILFYQKYILYKIN